MEGLKNTVNVGSKPTKLLIFVATVVSLILSLALSGLFIGFFDLGYQVNIIIIAITFVVTLLLYVPAMVSHRYHWNVSKQYLEYYGIDDYFQQLKYVLSVINGKENVFAFRIKLTEIKSIRLYWSTRLSMGGTPAHKIYFGITLNDGSIVTFDSLVTTSNQEYIDAIKYLKEECNIQIEDKYNLLQALENPNIRLAAYIDKIEKQRGKWGSRDD